MIGPGRGQADSLTYAAADGRPGHPAGQRKHNRQNAQAMAFGPRQAESPMSRAVSDEQHVLPPTLEVLEFPGDPAAPVAQSAEQLLDLLQGVLHADLGLLDAGAHLEVGEDVVEDTSKVQVRPSTSTPATPASRRSASSRENRFKARSACPSSADTSSSRSYFIMSVRNPPPPNMSQVDHERASRSRSPARWRSVRATIPAACASRAERVEPGLQRRHVVLGGLEPRPRQARLVACREATPRSRSPVRSLLQARPRLLHSPVAHEPIMGSLDLRELRATTAPATPAR